MGFLYTYNEQKVKTIAQTEIASDFCVQQKFLPFKYKTALSSALGVSVPIIPSSHNFCSSSLLTISVCWVSLATPFLCKSLNKLSITACRECVWSKPCSSQPGTTKDNPARGRMPDAPSSHDSTCGSVYYFDVGHQLTTTMSGLAALPSKTV